MRAELLGGLLLAALLVRGRTPSTPGLSLQDLLDQIARIQEEIRQLQDTLNGLEQDIADAQRILDEIENTVHTLESQVEALRAELARLRKAIDDTLASIANLEELVRLLAQERDKLSQELGLSQQALENLSLIIQQAQTEVENLRGKLADAQKIIADLQGEIDDLRNTTIPQLQQQLRELRQKLSDAETKIQDLERQISDLNAQIDSLKDQIQKLQVVLDWLLYAQDVSNRVAPAVSSRMQSVGQPGVYHIPMEVTVIRFDQQVTEDKEDWAFDVDFSALSLGRVFAARPVRIAADLQTQVGSTNPRDFSIGLYCKASYRCCGGWCEACHDDKLTGQAWLEARAAGAVVATSSVAEASKTAYHGADWRSPYTIRREVTPTGRLELDLPGDFQEYEIVLRTRAQGWLRRGHVYLASPRVTLPLAPSSGGQWRGPGHPHYWAAAVELAGTLDPVQSRPQAEGLKTRPLRLEIPAFTGIHAVPFVLPYDQQIRLAVSATGSWDFNTWGLAGVLLFANNGGAWQLILEEKNMHQWFGAGVVPEGNNARWDEVWDLNIPSGTYVLVVWASPCPQGLNCPNTKVQISASVDYAFYTA